MSANDVNIKDWLIVCDNSLTIKSIGQSIQKLEQIDPGVNLVEYLELDASDIREKIAQVEELTAQRGDNDFKLVRISTLDQDDITFLVIPDSLNRLKKARFMVHEIKNPLTNITLSLELLKSIEIAEDDRDLLDVIARNTQKIKEVISTYSDFIRQ